MKSTLLLFACSLLPLAAHAVSLDDAYLEKVRFIQYHAPQKNDYKAGTQKLIQSVPPSDGAHLAALGRAFMRLKDYDNAMGVLISATRVAPSHADAHADLAFVSAKMGVYCELSRESYRRAIDLVPAAAELPHVQHAKKLCSQE